MALIRIKYLKELIVCIIITIIIFKLLIWEDSSKPDPENASLLVRSLNIKRFDSLRNQKSHNSIENSKLKGNLIHGENVIQEKLSHEINASSLHLMNSNNLPKESIDVALIFTNAQDNDVLQYHLRRAVKSLLQHAQAPIRIHLISDEESFTVGSVIIKEIKNLNNWNSRHVKLVYVSAKELATEVESDVKLLQEYFTNKSYSKYRDFLFFFSLFLDRLLPGLTNIILMDIDIKVYGDIAELYSHFSHFSETQVIGLSPELSPVYRHILSLYRSKNPGTLLGATLSEGGFPGFNSGVLLINIPKLKESSVIKSYLNRKTLDEKTEFYSFKGHLGDQDLFSLIALDHPEVFYTLPCGWNRQLCRWWDIKLYHDVFESYFECPGEIKILHGNCKTAIPEDKNR